MIKKVKSNKNKDEIFKDIKYALNLLSNKKQLKFITITNIYKQYAIKISNSKIWETQ